MSVHDLVFEIVDTPDYNIYDPEPISATAKTVRVTNMGTDALENLGIYIVPATNVGDVSQPADNPPYTDYQDVLTWGQGGTEGLKLTGVTQNSGSFTGFVDRTQGALRSNKIDLEDLAASAATTFDIEFITPAGEPARRYFIDLVVE